MDNCMAIDRHHCPFPVFPQKIPPSGLNILIAAVNAAVVRPHHRRGCHDWRFHSGGIQTDRSPSRCCDDSTAGDFVVPTRHGVGRGDGEEGRQARRGLDSDPMKNGRTVIGPPAWMFVVDRGVSRQAGSRPRLFPVRTDGFSPTMSPSAAWRRCRLSGRPGRSGVRRFRHLRSLVRLSGPASRPSRS